MYTHSYTRHRRWLFGAISTFLLVIFCLANLGLTPAKAIGQVGVNQAQTPVPNFTPGSSRDDDMHPGGNLNYDPLMHSSAITDPYISVDLVRDNIDAVNFGDGRTVNLTIDDPTNGPGIDYTASNVSWGSARFYLHSAYPLKPGMIVTLSAAATSKSTVIRDLGITAISQALDTFSGTADPGSQLNVSARNYVSNVSHSFVVTTGSNGIWTANFSGLVDINNDCYVKAYQIDNNGNETYAGFEISEPGIRARLGENTIASFWWLAYSPISITIDDPANGPGVDFSSTQMSDEVGGALFTPDPLKLIPGMVITVSDMASTKTYTIKPMFIAGVDVSSETIFGTSIPYSVVIVEFCNGIGCNVAADADSNGFWRATSSVDLVPGSEIRASLYDPTYTWSEFSLIMAANANDDILAAVNLGSVPSEHSIDSIGASQSPDDPALSLCGLNAGLASVWYKFSATTDREMTLDTFGSSFDTVIGVWSGVPGSLIPVACNDNAGTSVQSKLSFAVSAGSEYYIGISLYNEPLAAPTVVNEGKTTILEPLAVASQPVALKLHASTFADVVPSSWYYRYVEGFYNQGITSGCNLTPYRYCPDRQVTRAEMAVFILRSLHADTLPYTPTPDPSVMNAFSDLPVAGKEWMQPWIEEFYEIGMTTGCGANPLIYCPERQVTRAEMAVFVLRALHGKGYIPPAAKGIFADVPVTGLEWMQPWIEEFYNEGITTGCKQAPLSYCPEQSVTRAEMATFLDRAFDFPILPD